MWRCSRLRCARTRVFYTTTGLTGVLLAFLAVAHFDVAAAGAPTVAHVAASGGQATPAAAASRDANAVTWFFQISDIHLSRWRSPGIGPDLAAFASVLAAAAPAALLVTGDLVDGKAANPEASRQQPEEWQAYQRLWRKLAGIAGLDAARIIDMRGNHGLWDAARGGESDGFMRSSATAAALGPQSAAARVRTTHLPPRLLLHPPSGTAADAAPQNQCAACPAVALVGVDATPDLRLHGYTNFFGILNATTLAEAATALASAARTRCGAAAGSAPPADGKAADLPRRPPLVTYSHYPLGLISSAPRPGQPNGGGRGLASLLTAAGSVAHLSGHLHAPAGPFMYVRHKPGAGGGAALAEFELGDWAHSRRWRLVAVDGGTVTVADFSYGQRSIRSLEPSAVVAHHIVVVTSAAVDAPAPGALPGVRALVLPTHPDAPAVAGARLRWACSARPAAAKPPASGDVGMVPGSSGYKGVREVDDRMAGNRGASNSTIGLAQLLFLGRLEGDGARGCAARLWVQAVITDASGGVSTSPWRQAAHPARGGAVAAGFAGEAALDSPNLRTALFLGRLDLPRDTQLLTVAAWAVHLFALLLVPRLFGRAILSCHARLLTANGDASYAAGKPTASGCCVAAVRSRRQQHAPLRWMAPWCQAVLRPPALAALWPLKTMAECWSRCKQGPCFPGLLALNAILLTGPWHVIRGGSADAGLGLLFPWALLIRPPGRGLVLYPCADAALGGMLFTWAVVLPGTLWLAHASNTQASALCGKPPSRAQSWLSRAALVTLALLWCRLVWRVGSTYGPLPILLSPAQGWLPMLGYAWLQVSLQQGRHRPPRAPSSQ